MTPMIGFDTEAIGLTGPITLVQYGYIPGDEVFIHDPWRLPVNDTLALFEWFASHPGGVSAWHLNFDWFQVVKWYNLFRIYALKHGNEIPCPRKMHAIEAYDRLFNEPVYLRPVRAVDWYIVAAQQKYGYLRRQRPLIIPRVPEELIEAVQSEMIKNLKGELPFGCRVHVTKSKESRLPELFDLKVEINKKDAWAKKYGGLKLKHIAAIEAAQDPAHPSFGTVDYDSLQAATDVFDFPRSYGKAYFPFGGNWFVDIPWEWTDEQLRYAADDIHLLRYVAERLPEPESRALRDSSLAIGAANDRYAGFRVDHARREELVRTLQPDPTVPTYWAHTLPFILEATPAPLRALLKADPDLPDIDGEEPKYTSKKDKLLYLAENFPGLELGKRATRVLEARKREKMQVVFGYLGESYRLHPQVTISGTASNRGSGGGGDAETGRVGGKGSINAQGFDKSIRDMFPLKDHSTWDNQYPGLPEDAGASAEDYWALGAGDFDGFEVTIYLAIVDNDELTREVMAGRSIHGMFGAVIYGTTYEDIMADKKLPDKGRYQLSKNSLFTDIFGGGARKVSQNTGIPEEVVAPRLQAWRDRYGIKDDLTEYNLLDSSWEWRGEHIKSEVRTILGFPRSFVAEIACAKAAYDTINSPAILGCDPAKTYNRKDKRQSGTEATRSALWGFIKRVEARIQRIVKNHPIQSVGGDLCKETQVALWELQPLGVNRRVVQTLNNHDEVEAVYPKWMIPIIRRVLEETIDRLREIVPLLSLDWSYDLEHWGQKG